MTQKLDDTQTVQSDYHDEAKHRQFVSDLERVKVVWINALGNYEDE